MTKALVFCFIFCVTGLVAQSEEQLNAEPSMEEALEEMSKIMDTLDIQNLLDGADMNSLFESFGFGGEDMGGIMDSLNLDELFGGDFSRLFEGGEGMQGFDMQQLDKMMEESLGIFEQMDMSEIQKMMEGIDMSEIMKMFDGMDMGGMQEFMQPPASPETPTEDGNRRKLKKI